MAKTSETIRSDNGTRKTEFLGKIIAPGCCLLLELHAWIERWESCVSRYEEKLKDKLVGEIKLAGLEALLPERLEKHLILKLNRVRTFEDARLEIVTFVEAKFGSKIKDSKRSDTGSRGHSDPMDLMRSILIHLATKRVIESTRRLFQVRWSTFPTRLQCTQWQQQEI